MNHTYTLFSVCFPMLASQNQNGRSSALLPPPKSAGCWGAVFMGGNPGCGTGWAAGCIPGAATRSTFQARMELNQRPCHSRASMSNETFSSSPIWILNCWILSAPNTSKHILRGYWSWVSITYSCTFHSFPFLEIPPLGSSTAITLPCNSISIIFNSVTKLRFS